MNLFKFLNKKKYSPSEPRGTKRLINRQSGQYISPETAMKVSAFYSGVIYISTQIAKLPWMIKDRNNKELFGPLSDIINLSSNPEMNSFMLRLFMTQEAIIKGNGYAEIERDIGGRTKALWPIPSENVAPTRIRGELVYRIFGGSLSDPGEDAYLLPNEIFHLRNFYTLDGIMGQGLAHYAQNTLGIGLGSDVFAGGLFANGGLPSGVLETEGSLSDEAFLKIKEGWDAAHGGRKVGGTAILEEGIKYKPISHNPDVLQFLESRKFTVLEIARFLRLPPTKLYDSETSSYNNIEHANLEVAVDTLDAWARNYEMEADVKLLNNGSGGRRTELDLYAVFRGDMDSRSQYFSRMMQDGAMTPNEIRTKEGLAPYEGGDRYYIANNNFSPVDRLDEIIDSQMKAKESTKQELPKQENATNEVDDAIVSYLKKRS